MSRGKVKNISNRKQGNMATPECNIFTIGSPDYAITLEKQDSNLKSLLLMMIEDIKENINNSLQEIQENTVNSWKPLKSKDKIPLKNYRKTLLNR